MTRHRLSRAILALAGAVAVAATAPGFAHADSAITVRPGEALFSVSSEGKRAICTAGLVGREGSQQMVFTAGHCFRPGEDVHVERDGRRVLIGTVYSSHNEPWILEPGDPGAKQDMSGYTAITLNSSADVSTTTEYGDITIGDPTIAEGEQLCHIGHASGYVCGPVLAVGDRRVDVEAEADHGDSGGPVFRVKRRSDGSRALVLVGIQVAIVNDEVMTVNPLINLVRNLNSDLTDWNYYAEDLS